MKNKFTYQELLDGHKKYGTTKQDILDRKGYNEVLENVVIAPWWKHSLLENSNLRIEQVGDKVYNVYGDDVSFTYIEIRGMGAPIMIDAILSLGVSKCKNILFIGSVGSLDSDIKIGDIVIPTYSIDGVGATRYLNKNLEDNFGNEEYPNKDFTDKLIKIVSDLTDDFKYHCVPNYSVDTIFAQFAHIDEILNIGAKTIEMETSVFFKAAEIANLNFTGFL